MKRSSLLLVLLAALIVFLVSCESKVKVYEASLLPQIKIRELEILLVSPKETVEAERENDAIIITFNQPMVPLGDSGLEDSGKDDYRNYLKIEPKINGKYKWQGTATLAFIPEKPLPLSTSFKVTVPKGIESLSGQKLKEDYTWNFETLRPDLLNSYPENNAKDVELNSNIYLRLNQVILIEKAKDFIELRQYANKKDKLSVTLREVNKDEEKKVKNLGWKPENVIVIDPEKDLLQEATYEIKLLPGLQGKEGELGLKDSKLITFKTFDYFKIIDISFPEDPEDEIAFYFTNPVSTKELANNIRFNSEIKIPDSYKEDPYAYSSLRFYLPFSAEKKYEVKILKELKDIFGNKLDKDLTYKFKTGSYHPTIILPKNEGVIEGYADLNFPVKFLNIDKVKKQLILLNKEEIINESKKIFEGGYATPYFPSRGFFDIDKLWEINLPKNAGVYLPINLRQVLPESKKGVVIVQLDALKKVGFWQKRFYRSLLQVTNLGITAKFSPENNLICVTNLKDSSSVKNAKVEIRDDDNKILFQGLTDKNGFIKTPGWAKFGLKKELYDRENPKQWVFASKNNDLAFLNSHWETGIYPYDFNIDYKWDQKEEEFSGYIYTERGLYRSSEDVHIKGMLREKKYGKWEYPDVKTSIKTLNIKITDSRDETVLVENVSISKLGSFNLTYKLKEDAPSGLYQIEARDLKDKFNFYGSFRVEAYTPAQFEVTSYSEKESYIFKDKFKGYIKGWYLFGAPMNNEKVSWSLMLNPAYYTPPGHEDYNFGSYDFEEYESNDESKTIAEGEGALDNNGRTNVKANLDPGNIKNSMNLVFEGTVTSQNKTQISDRKNVIIHKGEYYIGIKIHDRFGSSRKKLNINIIAVTPLGKKLKEKVNVKIFKRIWHSARKAGIEGAYEWVTEVENKEVLSKTITTGSASDPATDFTSTIEFTPPSSGSYIVQAEGEDKRGNKIKTDSYFYAWGDDYYPWERRDDDKIEIIKDKTNYKPGDTARLIVKSPYDKARALITIEREYIIEKFVVENLKPAQVINLPIKKEYLPNVYVSAVLLKGRVSDKHFSEDGDDLGKPSFKIGYINLPVAPEEKRLNIKINLNKKEYLPNEDVTLEVGVKDKQGKGVSSELSLTVADEGVLGLINFQTPDPFDSFYSARELSVATGETRAYVLGMRSYSEKGKNRGGDKGGSEKDAGFFYRSRFKATAYWNPEIITDNNGKAKITFKLPENLTTFRIMATAHTKDSFGKGEEKVTVKKPLVLLPSIPRFARVGDVFQAGVLVHNTTNKEEFVEVAANVNGLELSGKNQESFKLKNGDEKEVLFSFNAKNVGEAVFYFKAQMGNHQDVLKFSIPVKAPHIKEAYATFNDTTANINETLFVPEDIYPGGSLEVTASSSIFSGLRNGIEYLSTYHYECLEQIISKILPLILAEKLVNSFDIPSIKGEELRKIVSEHIKEFKDFQKNSGGFGFWKDSSHADTYLTAYLLYALHHAKKNGYFVNEHLRQNEDMIKKSLSYLRNSLSWTEYDNSPYNINSNLAVKAFALYSLSLWGIKEESYFNLLYEKIDQVPLSGKAMLLKTANVYNREDAKNKIKEILLNKIKLNPASAHFEDEYEGSKYIFDTKTKVTAIILQSILEANIEFPHSSKIVKWLLETKKKGRWANTHENQYAFNALLTYFEKHEKDNPNFKAEILVNKKKILKELFKDRSLSLIQNKISLDDMQKGERIPVNIKKKGKGRLYYGLRLLYSPKTAVPRDEGLIVFKKIEPVEKEGRGSIYKVTLTLLSPQDQLFVVVDDPVPAGFEVVNTSFYTESEALKRKLSKMQEKRRWWGSFEHFEIYDDKVLLFSNYLQRGEHKYTYFMKGSYNGKFLVPFTKAECMYEPEIFGTSEQKYIEVK